MGSGGGIEQVCSLDYRQRWEGGRQWYYDQSAGGVREVRMNFSAPTIYDDAKDSLRFRVGSRWVHEDGREWVCSDATEEAAVWDLRVDERYYRAGGSFVGMPVEFSVALGDETSAATTGTKVTWRVPYAMTVTSVRIECVAAPTGSVAIIDVQEAGTTIFSVSPQIAISETTSVGGAVPGTLSDNTLEDNAVLTFIIDQIGSTEAGAGYKVTLIGTRA